MFYPFAGQQVLIAADRLHVFHPRAAHLWQNWQAHPSAAVLAEQLARDHGLPLSEARMAADQILTDWQRAGLLDAPEIPVAPFPPAPPPALHDAPPSFRVAWMQDYQLADQPWRLQCANLALWAILTPPFAHLAIPPVPSPEPASIFSILPEPAGLSLWRGGHRYANASSPGAALMTLFGEIAEFGYREQNWLAALHAAAIHDGARALLLPALGGTGKTTLTAALLAAGYGYLSDDVAPLDAETLGVWPLPLPLRIKPGSVPVLRERYPELDVLPAYGPPDQAVRLLPPPRFSLHATQRRYPVAGLVFPEYRPAAAATVQPISPLEALQRLIAAEALFQRPLIPQHIQRLLAWLEATPAWRLEYDSVSEAGCMIRKCL